jgi:hypothetical protein
MLSRAVRPVIVVFGILAVMAGCGNFSLSSLLDTPPGGPSVPRELSISPATINAETSSDVQFTAQGGAGGYEWSADVGSITVDGLYAVPTSSGTYTVTVTDDAGITRDATVIATASIPLSLSPAGTPALPIVVSTGSATTFNAAGGSGSYTWEKDGGGTLAPAGDTALFTAPAGAEVVTVRVRDALAPTVFREATVSVTVPVTLTISPKAPAILVGTTVTFSAAGTPGPYAYAKISGSGTLTDNVYEAPPFAEDEAIIEVRDDLAGVSDRATVRVYYPITIIPTAVTLEPGATYQFSASGGVPPYSYAVTSGTGTMGGLDGDIYTAPGAVEPANTVTVTDALGNPSPATVTIAPPPAGWSIASVDTTARTGSHASLALDPAGGNYYPRIAYQESETKVLRYASFDGSTWSTETAGPPPSAKAPQFISLALDSAARPRIAYYDGVPARNLVFVQWDGASWTTEVVDSAGDVGQYASLAIDSLDRPRIAYYSATNGVPKYAAWNGSSWDTQVVDPAADAGQYVSLALDSSDRPRIAYYDATGNRLKYAAWNGSSWDIEIVDSAADVGQYASLALDSSDRPRIAYYDATNTRLLYKERNGAWAALPDVVDNSADVGQYASLALDGSDQPRIAYYDATNDDLLFAQWSGSWGPAEVMDSAGDVGKYASLKLNAAGKPRIAYFNRSTEDLRYAEGP